MIAAVLFDVDHTLIDTAAAFGKACAAVRQEFLPGSAPAIESDMLQIWQADAGGYYRAYTRGELSFDEQRRIRADLMMRSFGGDGVDAAAYPAWLEVFWSAFESGWQAFEDVEPALAELRRAGVATGIVTNAGTALQRRKLAAAGLGEFFGEDAVVIGVDQVERGKPYPEIFRAGVAALGAVVGQSAYVGDEPDIDARAAAAAGLTGVWLDRPGAGHYKPDAGSPDAFDIRPDGAVSGRTARISGLSDLARVLFEG